MLVLCLAGSLACTSAHAAGGKSVIKAPRVAQVASPRKRVPATKRNAESKLTDVLQQIDRLAERWKGKPELTSPIAWRQASADFGLPGLDLPLEVGGRGFSARQMVEVFEHMGKLSLDMRDMPGGGHVRPLLRSKTPEVRDVARQVAKGEAYVAVAVTEEDAGSNIRAMKSQAAKVKGGYVLSGEKMFNARFETATHVVVFARSPVQDSPSTKLDAFLLPKDYPGLDYTQLAAHGLHGNSFGGVRFDHLFVPEKFRIGGEGEGGRVFREHFLYWRLMQAAAAIGTGKGALDQAVARMRTRQAFGGPIGRFTHFQQDLAQHTTNLKAASLLVREAAGLIDRGDYDGAAAIVAMAKGEGVEWALKAADFSMELHGADGYSSDRTDLGQRVRDLQGLRIADGTTHVLRQDVVRHVYGGDLWEMAIGQQKTAAPRAGRHPSTIFTELRNRMSQAPKTLVSQLKYSGLVKRTGGGPCPTTAAAQLIQGIAAMARRPGLNLDEVMRSLYKDKPALYEGRLTNAQVVDVLDYISTKYLPGVRVELKVDYQRTLQPQGKTKDSTAWTDFDSSLLQARENELKLVSYDTVQPSGFFFGRHFVILKDREDDTLTVVDPVTPMKDHFYRMSRVALPGDGAGSSLQLVRPGSEGMADADTLTVNSVFTVKIVPKG
jgi:alkylation response protein AidB-like acyl-CoA dehydrogenase